MSKKILVADDSPTVRNVAQSLFGKHGYEVLLADDGAKALSVVKTTRPDLVLLNSSLSVVDGEQVCRELRQNEDLKDVPVIMILSVDEKEKERKLKEIGVDSFVNKPFNPKEILEHVKRLLGEEEVASVEKEQKGRQNQAQREDDTSAKAEMKKTDSEKMEFKTEDSLNIVDTSDLVEGLGSSSPTADGDVAHGFDWFLHELKKEAQEGKEDVPAKERASLSEETVPEEKVEPKEESKVSEINEKEKGYEEFVKDLKLDLGEPHIRQTQQAQPSGKADISASQLDQLFSDLKERIAERVAQEVAEKITPELLEKIIREEMTKVTSNSS
jgi:DNA-binding response OmpR family regulator